MAFVGPLSLGSGETPDAARQRYGAQYPGLSGFTVYAGNNQVGFESGPPVQGLMPAPSMPGPSTAAYNPGAGFFEGAVPSGAAESVTGAISGPGTPSIGSAPGQASAPGVSNNAFGLGFSGAQPGSVVNAGVNAAVNAATMGFAGQGTPGSNVAGVIGSLAGGALGVPFAGPLAAGLYGGVEQGMTNSAIDANPAAHNEGMLNSAVASLGMVPGAVAPGALGIDDAASTAGTSGAPAGTPGGEEGEGGDTAGNPTSSSSSSGDTAGDPSVICAELHRQGFLDPDTYRADEAFGAQLRREHPDVLAGYHRWAPAVVRVMQRSRLATWLVWLVAKPWTREMRALMEDRPSPALTGCVLMVAGFHLCRWLGTRVAVA